MALSLCQTRARDYHYDTFLFFAITSKLPIAMLAISAVAGATFALTVVWSVYPAVAIVFFSVGLAVCPHYLVFGIHILALYIIYVFPSYLSRISSVVTTFVGRASLRVLRWLERLSVFPLSASPGLQVG